MDMTWAEVIANIRDLGFEEQSTMEQDDYKQITINSVNRAIDTIFWNVVEPYKSYFHEVSNRPVTRVVPLTKEGEVTEDAEDSSVVKIPSFVGTEQGLRVTNYDSTNVTVTGVTETMQSIVENESYDVTASLKDPETHKWEDGTTDEKVFRVYKTYTYTWDCPNYPLPKINDETPDDYSMENDVGLPDKVVYLLPLLASYYVWLDDDVEKAVYYYNMYDSELSKLIDTIKNRNGKVVMYGGLLF